jgi:hypothetical protein
MLKVASVKEMAQKMPLCLNNISVTILRVGLKSNRSFRDFPYYGKITKSKYCPTEKLWASAKCAVNNPNVKFSVGQYSDFIFKILSHVKTHIRVIDSTLSASPTLSAGPTLSAHPLTKSFLFFRGTVFGFYYFSAVWKVTERPVGF